MRLSYKNISSKNLNIAYTSKILFSTGVPLNANLDFALRHSVSHVGVNIIEGKSCKNAGSALVGSRFFTAFFFQYNYLEERKEHNMSQQVYPQIKIGRAHV